ncbi:MAG: hypothetical protein LBT74_04985 [Acidobacteriota bacterium]|nr:hypothetical protein [Acidobacteriota bacterium]
MGIANYTNLSERLNAALKSGRSVSIAEMVQNAACGMLILASEGEVADQSDLENGFINIVEQLYRAGKVKPVPAGEDDVRVLGLFDSGELAAHGYGGADGDRFLLVRWVAAADELPVIVNINL